VATGMALAEKQKKSGVVTTVFLGDGTLGEGAIYEALNMAALWQLPILYVLENNGIAQTTPAELAVAGSMAARFTAFGIPTLEIDTSDVLEIRSAAGSLLAEVRSQTAPRALIIHTARFGPHSKGDDTRDPEVVARLRRDRDPVQIQAARLTLQEKSLIEAQVNAEIREAFEQALSAPYPEFEPGAASTGELTLRYANRPQLS